MCCHPIMAEYDKLVKKHPPGKPFTLWKTLNPITGLSNIIGHPYEPGVHYARTTFGEIWDGKYYMESPRGIHVHRHNPLHECRICVKVDTADLAVADKNEAVFRKIEITNRQWMDYKIRISKIWPPPALTICIK